MVSEREPRWLTECLLDAHRQEFLDECHEKGFTPDEAAECLLDFERDSLTETKVEETA